VLESRRSFCNVCHEARLIAAMTGGLRGVLRLVFRRYLPLCFLSDGFELSGHLAIHGALFFSVPTFTNSRSSGQVVDRSPMLPVPSAVRGDGSNVTAGE
jgi:hypothetical protein